MMSDAIKILIVEDEMIIAAKISMYLEQLGYEVLGIHPRAEEGLIHIKNNRPDIVLLDIQLKGSMDGIALANTLHKDSNLPVIFLTANSDDATFQKAKMAKPYAFLTKPFRKMDLQRALELTLSLLDSSATDHVETNSDTNPIYAMTDRIFVYDNGKMIKVLYADIFYVQAERNYCKVVAKSKTYLLSVPMKSVEDKLPLEQFHRIHRSHIVNLTQVDEVDEGSVKIDGTVLPISKSYKSDFLSRINRV